MKCVVRDKIRVTQGMMIIMPWCLSEALEGGGAAITDHTRYVDYNALVPE